MGNTTITSIFLPDEDRVASVEEFLNLPESEVFALRRALREVSNATSMLCSICFQPLLLAGTTNQTHYFRHKKDSDDCPIKTTCSLTKEQIEAMKYNGQKEGRQHKENKNLIASILRGSGKFDKVRVEKTFREQHSTGIAKSWRRPDITALHSAKQVDIAFELQVSTTFIDVIIQREAFYKDNGAYIFWVFLSFDNKRFTELDIFFANRQNAFVFDEAAKEASSKESELYLTCYYRKYEAVMAESKYFLEDSIVEELICVSELTFDSEAGKLYYVDTEALKENVNSIVISRNKEIAERKKRRKSIGLGISNATPLLTEPLEYKGLSKRIYDNLVKWGRYDSFACPECGNSERFRVNACFVYCRVCEGSVDY